jgi:hypothetical protein
MQFESDPARGMLVFDILTMRDGTLYQWKYA